MDALIKTGTIEEIIDFTYLQISRPIKKSGLDEGEVFSLEIAFNDAVEILNTRLSDFNHSERNKDIRANKQEFVIKSKKGRVAIIIRNKATSDLYKTLVTVTKYASDDYRFKRI